MNLNKNIRNHALIFSIVIILMISSTPISTLFSYKSRNDINGKVNTIRTSSGNTWTVDDDGPADFDKIQDAIDAATSGDTIIVKDGFYIENIDIATDDLAIRSENGPLNTIIQPTITNKHIITISANDIEINGFTVENSGNNYAGIYFYHKYPELSNLIVRNNYYGIRCYLRRFLIYGNLNVWNSNFSENFIGISSYSDFSNRYGRVKLNYCNFSYNEYGTYSSDWCSTIANFCNFSYNTYGMYGNYKLSLGTDYSIFNHNTYAIYGQNTWSIWTLNSTFSFNHIACKGIGMTDFISDDSIFQGNLYGVDLQNMYNDGDSQAVIIHNTDFIYNDRGIYINNYGGVENEVINCTFQNNYIVAIDLISSSYTRIYLNTFIDNDVDIDTHNHGPFNFYSPNLITYGYKGIQFENYLGNYWKRYSGTDEDNDGLGDIPYIIDSINQDQYPLILPFDNFFEPEWIEIPTDQEVELGSRLLYNVSAFDESGINYYWISDTEHFEINSSGWIVDKDFLELGVYELEIRAYDPNDNYCTATITVTVVDSTSPFGIGSIYDTIPNIILPEFLTYTCTSQLIGSVKVFDQSPIANVELWSIDPLNGETIAEGFVLDTTHHVKSPFGVYDYRYTSDIVIWTTNLLTEGVHLLNLRVYDAQGNVANKYFNITVFRLLNLKLSGEFDYLEKEDVNVSIVAHLIDAETNMEVNPSWISDMGVVMHIVIWDSEGNIVELPPGITEMTHISGGIFRWQSHDTIKKLDKLFGKGVYIVSAYVVFNGSYDPSLWYYRVNQDVIQFHVDPPGKQEPDLWIILMLMGYGSLIILNLALAFFYRRKNRRTIRLK